MNDQIRHCQSILRVIMHRTAKKKSKRTTRSASGMGVKFMHTFRVEFGLDPMRVPKTTSHLPNASSVSDAVDDIVKHVVWAVEQGVYGTLVTRHWPGAAVGLRHT